MNCWIIDFSLYFAFFSSKSLIYTQPWYCFSWLVAVCSLGKDSLAGHTRLVGSCSVSIWLGLFMLLKTVLNTEFFVGTRKGNLQMD